jgi:hypothetical protein
LMLKESHWAMLCPFWGAATNKKENNAISTGCLRI